MIPYLYIVAMIPYLYFVAMIPYLYIVVLSGEKTMLVTTLQCASTVIRHLLVLRSQTLTLQSSAAEKSCNFSLSGWNFTMLKQENSAITTQNITSMWCGFLISMISYQIPELLSLMFFLYKDSYGILIFEYQICHITAENVSQR